MIVDGCFGLRAESSSILIMQQSKRRGFQDNAFILLHLLSIEKGYNKKGKPAAYYISKYFE